MFIVECPVQLPLHELYFDLTLIRAMHTKKSVLKSKTYIFTYLKTERQTYCINSFQHATSDQYQSESYSPCHGDSRLLAISYSCSRITDYNPYPILSYFIRLAKTFIFASFCLGICGTSIAHNIKAMMTCLNPYYHT